MATNSFPNPSLPNPGSAVFLRWSNDGGMTWSNELSASSGAVGQYAIRTRWLRLGRARNRVFEVYGTDPVPQLVLIGVELGARKGAG